MKKKIHVCGVYVTLHSVDLSNVSVVLRVSEEFLCSTLLGENSPEW